MNQKIYIVLIIIIIFITLILIYNPKYSNINKNKDINIETDEHIDEHIDENIELLQIIKKSQKNALEKFKSMNIFNNTILNNKETFKEVITLNDANIYLDQLNKLNSYIEYNYSGSSGLKNMILDMLKNANIERNANKETLLQLLTNLYLISYIEQLGRKNAEAYKVYIKYDNPKNNKYYSQFLSS
jgi:hypothetical protein